MLSDGSASTLGPALNHGSPLSQVPDRACAAAAARGRPRELGEGPFDGSHPLQFFDGCLSHKFHSLVPRNDYQALRMPGEIVHANQGREINNLQGNLVLQLRKKTTKRRKDEKKKKRRKGKERKGGVVHTASDSK